MTEAEDGAGDSYMRPDNPDEEPVRDEQYFEEGHSSPHNPPRDMPYSSGEAIPDDAGLGKTIPARTAQEELDDILRNNIREIIPIAPGSKFVILAKEEIDPTTLEYISVQLEDWWKGDLPFLVIGGAFELVKVDDDDEEESYDVLVDCGAENCPGHIVGSGVCEGLIDTSEYK